MHCRMYCRSGHVLRRWKIVTEKSKVVRRGLFELCAAVAEAVCNVCAGVLVCSVCPCLHLSVSVVIRFRINCSETYEQTIYMYLGKKVTK